MMKKILLLLAMCLMLTACSAKEAAPMTTAGIAEAVAKAAAFTELTDVNESYLEKYLLIDADDLSSWVMRRDATRATPEMILVRIRRRSGRPCRNTMTSRFSSIGIISLVRCSSWRAQR